MSPGTEIVTLTLECGTLQLGPRDQYLFALESWLHHYGDRNAPEAKAHMARFRDIFYPADPAWMRSVRAHGASRWMLITGGVRRLLSVVYTPLTPPSQRGVLRSVAPAPIKDS